MSEPDPLSSLFQAGRAEVPAAAAKAKAAAALGIGAAAGTTAAAAGVGAATVLKVGLAIAVVGGGAFVGGMQLGEKQTEEKYQAQIAELQRKVDEKPVSVIVAPPVLPPPAPVVEEPAPPPKPVVAGKPVVVAPKEEDTLKLELAALDRARTRMKDDDHDGALKELATYDQKFPQGAMAAEAALMRIEALQRAGRREDAEALGKRMLEQPIPELMKQRVRRLLDGK